MQKAKHKELEQWNKKSTYVHVLKLHQIFPHQRDILGKMCFALFTRIITLL